MLRLILSGCCTQNTAGRAQTVSLYLPVMKKPLVLAAILLGAPGALIASLTSAQMASADTVMEISVPTPAEFFSAIDKVSRPDWASFYRDPGPTSFPTRPQTAFHLGTLVADGYIAVEAQDGQQVKNTGKDIITLARALGVGENVLARGKSISDFADKNDWFALREELEATTNEVRRAMIDQRDEALASLILAGSWTRAWQVGGRAAELSGDEDCAALLGQPDLAAVLQERLRELPDQASDSAILTSVGETFGRVRGSMTAEPGTALNLESAKEIHEACARLVAQMGAK